MNILDQIVDDKRKEIDKRKKETPINSFSNVSANSLDFYTSLKTNPIGLIAEIKRKSPSAGEIRNPFNPIEIAQAYENSGASAISCLIDAAYFGGSDDDFRLIRESTSLPMLYKEFVIDEWQIFHAHHLGASAILLIAAVLDDYQLKDFSDCIHEKNLSVLIEVHDIKELERVVISGAKCIGINNRNLKTFETSISNTFTLIKQIPDDIIVVSESGINSANDVLDLQKAGVDALLIGEYFLRQQNPGDAVQKILSKINI